MKKVLLLVGIFLSLTSVNASDNVLQTIEINPVKDTYNMVLVADKAVDVKKVVQAPNKVTLNMKNIRASKSLNTVYNNVSNVDSVLVEQKGDGISIYFQAENAANANIAFDSLAPAEPVAPVVSKNIKLNNPIESYAPVYSEDYKTEKTSNLFNKLKLKQDKLDGLAETLDDEPVSDTANKFISFGLVIVFVVAALKLFKRKENDMKIGLGQNMNNREINMFGGMLPAEQVNRQNPEKPFTTVNYGLNAYQRGNVNPYETAPIHNPKLRNMVQQMPQEYMPVQTAVQPQAQNVAMQQRTSKKMTTPVNTAPVNQSNPNIDNLKFLESMTAIYEKSGRHDLARGLKASLTKNNIK